MLRTTAAIPNITFLLLAGILFLGLIISPNTASSMDLSAEISTFGGNDDNIDRKNDHRKTASPFFGVNPALSAFLPISDRWNLALGYDFTYTRYTALASGSSFHGGWSEITAAILPGWFAGCSARIESLDDQGDPENSGWGYRVAPSLTRHVSDALSIRLSGAYGIWEYENRDFDLGRWTIRLDEVQIDHTYEGELGITYLLLFDTLVEAAYRFTRAGSSNAIDEHTVHHFLMGLKKTVTPKLEIALGYHFSSWDYPDWRVGPRQRLITRNDERHRFWTFLTYAITEKVELFLSFDKSLNSSNIGFKTYERTEVMGGLRFHWAWFGI